MRAYERLEYVKIIVKATEIAKSKPKSKPKAKSQTKSNQIQSKSKPDLGIKVKSSRRLKKPASRSQPAQEGRPVCDQGRLRTRAHPEGLPRTS